MAAPLFFSIVIPFFNRENYLDTAIKSVLSQSNPNWELILVDDDSTDGSLKIAKSYMDSRIRVLSHSPNQGNAFARNMGWKSANYPWVTYLDSDDWYEPDYLEKLSLHIDQNPSVAFFWTGVRFVNGKSRSSKEEFWEPLKVLPSDTFFDQLRIGTNAGVCFAKRVLEELGGFEVNLRAAVDREFFLRISQNNKGQGLRFTGVNCLIGSHNSVRKSFNHQAEAYNFMINRYKSSIEKNSSRKTWWYHKAMWLNLYAGNRQLALQYLKKLKFGFKSLLLFSFFLFLPIESAKKLHKALAS